MNERQFGQVIRYQAELYFDPKTEGAEKRPADILEQKQLPHELIGKTDFLFRTGENFNSASAVVMEPEKIEGYYGLKDPERGEKLRPTDEAVLIPPRAPTFMRP